MARPELKPTATPDGRPDFLARLGVLLPCSPQDVEQAYLEKVKLAHPDRGGTQQQFLELQDAYQRAKEYAKFQSSRRGWLADSIERYARQQELIAEIEQRGGSVRVEILDWLAREIGEDFAQVLEQISAIRLTGPAVDDRAIDLLVKYRDVLGQLHELDLSDSRVTNSGVAKLATFAYLRKLDLSRTSVDSVSLGTFTRFDRLEKLDLVDSRLGIWGRFWLRAARPDVEIATHRGGATRGFRSRAAQVGVICLLYVILIATLTHTPLDVAALPKLKFISLDKLFHFLMYGGLSFLLSALVAARWNRPPGNPWIRIAQYLAVIPAAALYGALDEITQPYVKRTADPLDWIADLLGAIFGVLVFLLVRAVLKRQAERRCALRASRQASPMNLPI